MSKSTLFIGHGQINMHSAFGTEIYNICKLNTIKNIFEVGTWNGEGSTICIMNAIIDKTNSILYSLESNPTQYTAAINFWSSKDTHNKLKLINGVLHNEYATEDEIKETCGGIIPCYKEHYIPEKQMLEHNTIIKIDEYTDIDIIILDGGEYTTMGDFKVLMTKYPKIIMLDDTIVYKCKKIRQQLLDNPEYYLYKEDLKDRHGWSIFVNKSFTSL
jgi:hypothetical protein